MNEFEPISDEGLRELQKNSHSDDSVHIPTYEGMSPQEAAKIKEVLEKKIGEIDSDEERQYEAAQQIADKGGVLPSDLKPGNGPFVNDADMMKKEGE